MHSPGFVIERGSTQIGKGFTQVMMEYVSAFWHRIEFLFSIRMYVYAIVIASSFRSRSRPYTRIEFFRKNYREIHGNQRIPKFPGIFTVFTVIFTGNHGNFYRNLR